MVSSTGHACLSCVGLLQVSQVSHMHITRRRGLSAAAAPVCSTQGLWDDLIHHLQPDQLGRCDAQSFRCLWCSEWRRQDAQGSLMFEWWW